MRKIIMPTFFNQCNLQKLVFNFSGDAEMNKSWHTSSEHSNFSRKEKRQTLKVKGHFEKRKC